MMLRKSTYHSASDVFLHSVPFNHSNCQNRTATKSELMVGPWIQPCLSSCKKPSSYDHTNSQAIIFFFLYSEGVESKLGPLGTSATYWPIVPAPGDCEDGEFGGNGRENRSIPRKPAQTPLCPPQIPLDQTRD
jgi:hypothetical protein